ILAVRGLPKCGRCAARHGPPWSGNDLSGKGPIPIPALVTAANTADVQISIRYVRGEVFLRSRVLTEKIPGAHKVSVLEIARSANVVEPARVPVERQADVASRKWVRGSFENQRIDRIPIGPIHIHFEIPL